MLVFALGLAGCSSETSVLPAAEGASSVVERPSEPVRVGVSDFAVIVESPGVTILDVRTPEEFAQGHIAGAINIPVEYPDYAQRVGELDPNGTYAVYCRSGNRSQPAVAALAQLGINGVYELESGTIGWTAAGQPLV
jgi:rhodanese-related sulfurtransferase